MKQTLTILLISLIMMGCKNEDSPTPKLTSILSEYIDDLPYLMITHDVDTVLYIVDRANNYPDHYQKNDTVHTLIKTAIGLIETSSIDLMNHKYSQIHTFDSLGLPKSIRSYGDIKLDVKYIWSIKNNSICKIAVSDIGSHDSTFYTFNNGRVEHRLEKWRTLEWRSTQYFYNKDGTINSIKDSLLRNLHHSYPLIIKTFTWKNKRLEEINEVFNPGRRHITTFDYNGFPESFSIINRENDSIVFKINKR